MRAMIVTAMAVGAMIMTMIAVVVIAVNTVSCLAMVTVRAVTTVGVALRYTGPMPVLLGMTRLVLPMPVGIRVPPEHELLNDEKDPQPCEQRDTNALRAFRSNTFNRIRKQRQQRRAQQSARRITDEVR